MRGKRSLPCHRGYWPATHCTAAVIPLPRAVCGTIARTALGCLPWLRDDRTFAPLADSRCVLAGCTAARPAQLFCAAPVVWRVQMAPARHAVLTERHLAALCAGCPGLSHRLEALAVCGT